MLHDGFSGNKLYSHYLLKKKSQEGEPRHLVIDRKQVLTEFFTKREPQLFSTFAFHVLRKARVCL